MAEFRYFRRDFGLKSAKQSFLRPRWATIDRSHNLCVDGGHSSRYNLMLTLYPLLHFLAYSMHLRLHLSKIITLESFQTLISSHSRWFRWHKQCSGGQDVQYSSARYSRACVHNIIQRTQRAPIKGQFTRCLGSCRCSECACVFDPWQFGSPSLVIVWTLLIVCFKRIFLLRGLIIWFS